MDQQSRTLIRLIMNAFDAVSMSRGALLLSVSLCFAPGCMSIESTLVTRDETNQTWEQHQCLNGIPITLKVPTHLKLYVFHKHYLEHVGNEIKPVNLGVVVRDFAHELMYTEKVFVVDFKRPAAGSANLRVDMTNDQYFDQIQHDITEETISQIAGLLGKIGPQGFAPQLAAIGEVESESGASTGRLELKSLVAVGIFEVDAPDFEQQVMTFINCHVNKAHDAWVAPPEVHGINRVGVGVGENLQVPYPNVPLCDFPGAPVVTVVSDAPPNVQLVAPPVEEIHPGIPAAQLPTPSQQDE